MDDLRTVIAASLKSRPNVFTYDNYIAPTKPLYKAWDLHNWMMALGLPLTPKAISPCFATQKTIYWGYILFERVLGTKITRIKTETEWQEAGRDKSPKGTQENSEHQEVITDTIVIKAYPSPELAQEIGRHDLSYSYDDCHPYSKKMPIPELMKMARLKGAKSLISSPVNQIQTDILTQLQKSPSIIRDESVVSPVGFTVGWLEPIYDQSWTPTSFLLNTIHSVSADKKRIGTYGNLWTRKLDSTWTRINKEVRWLGTGKTQKDWLCGAITGHNNFSPSDKPHSLALRLAWETLQKKLLGI